LPHWAGPHGTSVALTQEYPPPFTDLQYFVYTRPKGPVSSVQLAEHCVVRSQATWEHEVGFTPLHAGSAESAFPLQSSSMPLVQFSGGDSKRYANLPMEA
jgi:hypothetical protein